MKATFSRIKKQCSFILNLVPRTLKIAFIFRALKFQNFLDKHAPGPPPPPYKKKGTNSPLLIQSVTLFKPAGYFNFY